MRCSQFSAEGDELFPEDKSVIKRFLLPSLWRYPSGWAYEELTGGMELRGWELSYTKALCYSSSSLAMRFFALGPFCE